jgi:hypothetical protein
MIGLQTRLVTLDINLDYKVKISNKAFLMICILWFVASIAFALYKSMHIPRYESIMPWFCVFNFGLVVYSAYRSYKG